MPRLPMPGGDINKWGDILNEYLLVEHKADGTLRRADVLALAQTSVQTVNGKAPNTAGGVVLDAADIGAVTQTIADRRYMQKDALVYNVRDYGAVGDGISDDASAINSTIAAANAVSGTVFLPAGTYRIATPLTTLAARTAVMGCGTTTVITVASNFSGGSIFTLSNDYASVTNIYFMGGPNSTASANPAANAISVTAAKNCTIANIDARGLNGYVIEALGSAARGTLGLTIDNIRGTDIAYGIHIKGHSGSSFGMQTSITNVNLQLVSAGDALLVEDSWDVLVMNMNTCVTGVQTANASNIRIRGRSATVLCFNVDVGSYPTHPGNTPAVLLESGPNGAPENINLIGGIFQQSQVGLSITAGNNIFVQGVRMQENGTHGLSISGGSTIQINNCMFSHNGQAPGAGRYDVSVTTTNAPITLHRCEFMSGQGATAGNVNNTGFHVASAAAVWEFCNITGVGFTPANVFSGNPAATLFTSVGGGAASFNMPPSSPFAATTRVPIYTADAAAVGMVIRGSPSQTADLLRMEGSTGTKIANFDANGNTFAQRLYGAPSASYFTGPGGVSGSINAAYQSGTNVGVLVQRTATANGDMITCVDNANTVLAKIDYQGAATVAGLAVNGAFSGKRTAVPDTNYTATSGDYIIAYTSLTQSRTVTLPTAVGAIGRTIIVLDESGAAGVNTIIITPQAGQTINGAATKVINTAYGGYKMYANGSSWVTCP